MEESGSESKLGLVEIIALKVVRTGSDRINFKILEMVKKETERNKRAKIEDIIKETGLTKVPVNKRINELEKAGLVNRWRGTGLVMLTELGKIFIDTIDRSEDMVRDNLIIMLNSMTNNNKY